ncbi:aromatic ring-hydroxylating oxygenase subunit alpha [Chitinophaga vietnamensis]|uniref:aromatic ring-hydroxylating oxygenase subunit alpha n=1 Tax=Chitinophaga vietnamensis TaxID=2593957 RepID=UPI001177E3EB|nr:aromatic ring-hydroxylating dioxygenase subunit alpha [Chitinophaga vietnamensis]
MSIFHVDEDISVARTLHTDFYTSPDIYHAVKEKIFSPSWQLVGDVQQVSEPGQCHPFLLLPGYLHEPLLLTRDKDNKIRCMSNVCTHRGTVLVPEPCNSAHLRCRYHGRIFRLDGTFQSMPEFKEVKNFPTKEDDLTVLPLLKWGPLLFASLQSPDPAPYLAEMMQRLSWLPLHEFVFRPELSKDYYVQAHWALYCENYLEGFHIPFVHAGLNAVIDFGNYTTELFRYANLQLGIAKEGEACFDLPPESPDHGRKVAAYYFFVFPNMMFNFYPWGLSINIVEPEAINRTRVRFLTYVWKEQLLHTGAGADLDTVEMEDEEVVEAVQTGVRSRFYRHGRYSVTREQGTHHFHRIIASFMQS